MDTVTSAVTENEEIIKLTPMEELINAFKVLDVEKVKQLTKLPELNFLDDAVISSLYNFVYSKVDSKEVEVSAAAKTMVEVYKQNSNVVILEKMEEWSLEELEVKVNESGLSHLSSKLVLNLIKAAECNKALVLINSVNLHLPLELVDKFKATALLLESIKEDSPLEDLKESLKGNYDKDIVKELLLTARDISESKLLLLKDAKLYLLTDVLSELIRGDFKDFSKLFLESLNVLSEEDKQNLLVEATSKRREIVYELIQEHVTEIPDKVALNLLNSEQRVEWLRKVLNDPKFVCDCKEFINYSRSQKQFDLIMENPKINKYVKENQYEVKVTAFFKHHMAKASVKRKFDDF